MLRQHNSAVTARCLSRLLAILTTLLVAACAAEPTRMPALGDLLSAVDFDAPYEWEQYENAGQHVNFRIVDGVYRAEAWDEGFVWVLNSQSHSDVVIQVDTQQTSTFDNNAYGVMCRAAPTNNGDGYYFLISGDGQYTIRRGATDAIDAIVGWTPSAAIQQGAAINRVRAVCIGDYLALYVNNQFVGETRDDRYQRGFAGLAAGVVADGDISVDFDALRIWEAADTIVP